MCFHLLVQVHVRVTGDDNWIVIRRIDFIRADAHTPCDCIMHPCTESALSLLLQINYESHQIQIYCIYLLSPHVRWDITCLQITGDQPVSRFCASCDSGAFVISLRHFEACDGEQQPDRWSYTINSVKMLQKDLLVTCPH